MELKALFDRIVKQEIVDRINKLTSQTQRQCGKMNFSQVLAHVQMPIRIAFGTHQPKGSFLLRLIGPLFKSKLWDAKPYKQSLPTDPTFVMTGVEKDFEKEKTVLIGLVRNFNETSIQSERHPVFGKLNKHNW